MPELFDMIAGSETGAIIASTLVVKNDDSATMDVQPNKYFARNSMEYFVNNVDFLYKDSSMPLVLKVLITVVVISVVCSFAYLYTERTFMYPDFDYKIDNLKNLITLRKKQVKKKDYDKEKYE